MNFQNYRFPCLILFLILASPLSAQFGPGGGRNGGLFATAGPAQADRTITVGGRLTPTRKISHSIPVAGIVDGILVRVGDRVSEGQPLVRIRRDAIGETFRPVILESRLSGVVSEIQIYERQEVGSGTGAVTILDDRSFLLEASVSDRDAQAIRTLGPMAVTGTTPEGASFPGRILFLSQEPDYTTGLFTLTVEFSRRPDLFLGMMLLVDLPAGKSEGIGVEKTAVFTREGETYLWVLNDASQLALRKVRTGGADDRYIRILEGLTSGERYIKAPGGKEQEGLSLRDLIQANLGGGTAPGGN